MENLKNFIDSNINKFNNLSSSEIETYLLNKFDNTTIEYLKQNDRFDYNGICVYYVSDSREIWVENMKS